MGIPRGAKHELLTLVDHDPARGPVAGRGRVDETAGDFDAFYRREYPGLVELARVLAGPAVADVVAQEAMLAAFRKWDQVKLLESPTGWVRRVCLRKAVSLVRRRSVQRPVPRDAVGAGPEVDARLAQLKATSRRRGAVRAVAVVAAGAAVVAALGLLGAGRGPAGDGEAVDSTVTCRQALADTPRGPVQCLGSRVVIVRGPVDYTFRLPRGVPWKIDASGAPWAVDATMDPWIDSAGISVLVGVRAPVGGRVGPPLPAAELASWVASRRFLVATPVTHGNQDGLRTWTVEVRSRPGVPRAGPGSACSGVATRCHALLTWRQGSSLNEAASHDGELTRLTFLDVPGGGVVALVARADFAAADSLRGAAELLRSVDIMFAVG